MKIGAPQGMLYIPSYFSIIYTIELNYVLESLGFFYPCQVDDTQIKFTFEGITEAENKLGRVSNKVVQ